MKGDEGKRPSVSSFRPSVLRTSLHNLTVFLSLDGLNNDFFHILTSCIPEAVIMSLGTRRACSCFVSLSCNGKLRKKKCQENY